MHGRGIGRIQLVYVRTLLAPCGLALIREFQLKFPAPCNSLGRLAQIIGYRGDSKLAKIVEVDGSGSNCQCGLLKCICDKLEGILDQYLGDYTDPDSDSDSY